MTTLTRRVAMGLCILLAMPALRFPAMGNPAFASTGNSVRKPLPVIEVHRGVYAAVRPSDAAGWQGTVIFDHTVTTQGGRQLRRTTKAQLELWRQTCDLAGCIESDVTATGVGAPTLEWGSDLAKGSLSLPVVNVRVVRYAVEESLYRKLDETTLRVPLKVSFIRTSDKLQQALVANTTTISTTSVTKQVNADIRIALGDMALGAVPGSATGTTISTVVRR